MRDSSSASSSSSSERSSLLGEGKLRQSLVWLSGSFCSPTRLPVALVLSVRRTLIRMTSPKKDDMVILAILAGAILFILAFYYGLEHTFGSDPSARHWTINLIFNVTGYSIVFLPGFLILRYVRQNSAYERGARTCLGPFIRTFFYGSEETIDESIAQDSLAREDESKTEFQKMMTLVFCFFGLQVSYLTWGVLQEKIMTRTYEDSAGNQAKFHDSQFLVFVNRVLAFAAALLYLTFKTRMPTHRAPFYKYSFCSLSNIMSSWCQYEALKFVSFPTQVLAKASKLIPVMIMGKIVSKKKYEFYEYIVAVLISLGMVLFLFGSQEDRSSTSVTTFSGIILMIGYMASDSFTSNWQNELFSTYKMKPMQMMCGVNLFSCLLTAASLFQQGIFYTSLVFMSQYPQFTFDCVILSFCSATGQLFIYYTINQFGPVVFTIIMTLRMAMAVILSCIIYNHSISPSGIIGIVVVFGAMFLKIYCGHRLRRLKRAQQAQVQKPKTSVKT